MSKGTEEGDGYWGGRGGSGSVVEVNFKDGFGNVFVGLFVGMGGIGLLGKRAPSIRDGSCYFWTQFFFFGFGGVS